MIRRSIVANNAIVAAVPVIAIHHGLRWSLAATQAGDFKSKTEKYKLYEKA